MLRQQYPTTTHTTTKRAAANIYNDIGQVVNGGLEFGSPTNQQNMSGAWYTGTTPGTANTEFAVTHDLGRVPTGFLVFSINAAGILYRSTTTWTATQVFLKCNIASAGIVIFIT